MRDISCPTPQLSEFQKHRTFGEKLRDSKLTKLLIALLTYASAVWLGQYLSPNGVEFMASFKGGGGFRFFFRLGRGQYWFAIQFSLT